MTKRFLCRPLSLHGGKAERVPLEAMDLKQLEKGQKVEREHTNDPGIALMIASDHLAEFHGAGPFGYYDALEVMEKLLKKMSRVSPREAKALMNEFEAIAG